LQATHPATTSYFVLAPSFDNTTSISEHSFNLSFYLAVVHKRIIQGTEITTVRRDGIAIVIEESSIEPPKEKKKKERHK